MHIVVPIKQVPETSDVKMDPETGTMIRSGSDAVLNPLDLYALEAALRVKEAHEGTITVITMGPPSAGKVLQEALAMGCDTAVHLSDRAFGGADTWATSYTIAQAIKQLDDVDLVITGERATDGDTGQVGPGIASWLDFTLLSFVSSVEEITKESVIVERLLEEGYQRARAKLPAVLTVVKEIADPRLPTLRGKLRARGLEIPVWGPDDISADPGSLGLRGSPTRVVKIETPTVARECRVVTAEDDDSAETAVDELVAFLRSRELLTAGEEAL